MTAETGTTGAIDEAAALGMPDALFVGLCEWLDRKPLDSSNNVGLRYHPNTRAAALKACRILVGFAEHGVIDSGQAATVKP